MKKITLVVCLSLAVLILIVIGVLQLINQSSIKRLKNNNNVSSLKIEKSSAPTFKGQVVKFKNYQSVDGRIAAQYPENWESNNIDITRIVQEEIVNKYRMATSFTAMPAGSSQEYAQLAITKIMIPGDKKLEDIIKEFDHDMYDLRGYQVQTLALDINEPEIYQELLIKNDKIVSEARHSKGRIIIFPANNGAREAYLINVVVFDKDWPEYKEMVNFILQSLEINIKN